MTPDGQRTIKALCRQYGVSILSLNRRLLHAGAVLENDAATRTKLQAEFLVIGCACAEVGISMIVVPLVDNGRLDTPEQEDVLVDFLLGQQQFLAQHESAGDLRVRLHASRTSPFHQSFAGQALRHHLRHRQQRRLRLRPVGGVRCLW